MSRYLNPYNWQDNDESTSTLLDRLDLNVLTEVGTASERLQRRKREMNAEGLDVFEADRYKHAALFDSFANSLSMYSYNNFINKYEVVIVMFHYNLDDHTRDVVRMFNRARAETVRPNSSFAYVDCRKENNLCANEGVTQFPMFKVYKSGKLSGTIRDDPDLTAEKIIEFVEDI